MLPESNPVRRLRRPDEASIAIGTNAGRHGPAPLGRRLAAAALVGLSAVLTGGLAALPARAAEPASGAVVVLVAPSAGAAIDGGAPLDANGAPRTVQIDVQVINSTDRVLPNGDVRLFAAAAPLDDDASLAAWLDGGDGAPAPGADLGAADTRVILPGDSVSTSIAVPVSALDPGVDALTPVGLGAAYRANGEQLAQGHGVTVWYEGQLPTVRLAGVAPIVAPGNADGLIGVDELTAETAPTGALTRELDAYAGRSVAIGIDPRLIASIAVLGDTAPPSVLEWLTRLESLPNETFPLAYGDADLGLQARLGLDAPLAPIGFRDATAASVLAAQTAPPTPGAVPGDPATTAPAAPPATDDPDAAPLPDPVADLIAEWPFTRRDVAWPGAGTAVAGDAAFYAAGGLTTTIRSSVDVTGTDPAASSTVDGGASLVADERLSAAYQRAATATSDTGYRAAESQAAARLAVIAGRGDGDPVLAAFDRSVPSTAGRVAALLADLDALPWVAATGLDQVETATPVARTLVAGGEPESRVDLARRMVTAESDVTQFATILTTPELLTAPQRRSLLSSLSLSLAPDGAAWGSAASAYLDDAGRTLESVHVVPAAAVLVISSEVGIRPEIENLLPFPVTVDVAATPNNGRLIVEDDVTLTIEPQSRASAQIPVAAGVGNGDVRLTVRLTSPTGVPIGTAAVIEANVQADWEGIGAIVLAVIAVAFLGFGIYRSIRRRRRERGGPDAGDGIPAPDARPADGAVESRIPDPEYTGTGGGADGTGAPDDEDARG